MMMLIELMNIDSKGDFLKGLKRSRFSQIVLSALLGSIPGCLGGFASVSLYTHGIISFGALIAMMIASSGDEAFVMLALMPKDAVWIFLVLLVVAIMAGILTDLLYHPKRQIEICSEQYQVHSEDEHEHHNEKRHFSWKRVVMFLGVALFLVALVTGKLEHEEEELVTESGFNLLSEEWMYWLFGALGLVILGVLIWGNDHFVEEHLWRHIVLKHLPAIFLWSFGVLILLGFILQYVDISTWISSNTALMILLATLVGIIPESGPHMIFVTLYASGIVPLPVLLASCISQDGHSSLPLLAETKSGFLKAKLINCLVALAVGFGTMFFLG